MDEREALHLALTIRVGRRDACGRPFFVFYGVLRLDAALAVLDPPTTRRGLLFCPRRGLPACGGTGGPLFGSAKRTLGVPSWGRRSRPERIGHNGGGVLLPMSIKE